MSTSVELRDHYIYVGDERIPLLSGQIDYWLHPSYAWKKILESVKGCSLPMVSLYVAWRHHRLPSGELDFTGKTDPSRDLAHFLDLAADLGLWIFLRPGPWIMTHYADGGVPVEASQYHRLHPEFLNMSRDYFAELCEIIRPRLASNGGKIVLCQLDNEIEVMPSMRGLSGGTELPETDIGLTYYAQTLDAPVSSDTSWRHWLAQKYASIDAFNALCGSTAGSWDEIDVAGLIRDHNAVIKPDVMAYYEWYTTKYAAIIGDMLRAEKIDIPFALNTLLDMEPQNNVQFGKVAEIVGGDYWGPCYLPWRDTLLYSRHARHLRAVTDTAWSAEYQSITSGELIDVEGVYRPQNATYLSLMAMLFGLKGWNWYVFAERSVLYWAPINNYGGIIREFYDRFKQMHDEYLELDWPSYRAYSDGTLWFYRQDFWQDVQYSDPSTKPFYTHSETNSSGWGDWFDRLHQMDYDFDIYDPESDRATVTPGTSLIVAGHSRMDAEAQRRLLGLAEAGANVLFLSTPPNVDLDGNPTDIFGFLPRPGAVQGKSCGYNVRYEGQDRVIDTDFLALFDAGAVKGTDAAFTCVDGICGYRVQRGKGSILVLGFQPSQDFLADLLKAAGTVPAVRSNVARVLTSAWHRGEERLIVALNILEQPADATLAVSLDRLGLAAEARYKVELRLKGTSQELSGRELASLALPLAANSGELVRILPA